MPLFSYLHHLLSKENHTLFRISEFGVLTVVRMTVFRTEDGDSMFLWNAGVYLHVYMTTQKNIVLFAEIHLSLRLKLQRDCDILSYIHFLAYCT
jgi:hypothetical protein